MVQKLQSSEYLKRYDDMTADERQAYVDRVGEWLKDGAPLLDAKAVDFEARLQNVMQVSLGWNDQECQSFEQGARLLSALAYTGETWLPDMLYVKSARRAVMRMAEALQTVLPLSMEGAGQAAKPVGAGAKEEPAGKTRKGTQAVATFQAGAGDGDIAGGDHEGEAEVGAVPVRPRHIDQYVHLLPQKTQERASQVKDLLREFDDAREKMRLLMDDPTAKADDREAWAKKATGIDNRVRKIYDELDLEWAKLVKQGRVVLDDLGNARVVETAEGGDAEPERQELTSEQKARRRELRKWLVDTRRGNGDSRGEHVKKWKENFLEFLSLDGESAFGDGKVKAAADHYGIELDKLKR